MSARLPVVTAVPSGTILLDGNGDPLDLSRQYFNRWQRSIRHSVHVNRVAMRLYRMYGGWPGYTPRAYVTVRYTSSARACQFEADYIREGVYGFNQLIPVGAEIAFDIPGGDSGTHYRKLVLEKLGGQKA